MKVMQHEYLVALGLSRSSQKNMQDMLIYKLLQPINQLIGRLLRSATYVAACSGSSLFVPLFSHCFAPLYILSLSLLFVAHLLISGGWVTFFVLYLSGDPTCNHGYIVCTQNLSPALPY